MNPARPRTALLTVSGTIDPAIADEVKAGRRPRADFAVMAERFDADVLDHDQAARTGGVVTRLLRRVAGDEAMMAWACFRARHRYTTVFTDSEGVGLPYAALANLGRRPAQHVMIGHRISTRSKTLFHRVFRLRRRIDRIVVYATSQRDFAVERLGYRPDQVTLTSFMVDTDWWHEAAVTAAPGTRPMICSVGQEYRDYHTLAEAVRGLDVDVVIAAGSPWSRRPDAADELSIPDNVRVTKLSQFDLRQLYADSAFVVVPLEETDFQAGITTILEAMSMGRAVICTRTPGQTDTVVDGRTGILVPPRDPDALRRAIVELLDDPARARRLGAAGRDWVREHADVVDYAARLAALVG